MTDSLHFTSQFHEAFTCWMTATSLEQHESLDMGLDSPVFSVIHGFVVSLKVNGVCNCRKIRSAKSVYQEILGLVQVKTLQGQ